MACGGPMSGPPPFTSDLAEYFEAFIALERASGAAYRDSAQRYQLHRFDRYLAARWSRERPLTAASIHAYFDSYAYLPLASRRNPIGIAWKFLSYAVRHGAPIQALPPRPEFPGGGRRNRDRHVFTVDEVRQLLEGCRQLRPRGSLRPYTYETLFGLLYATGVRISEALGIWVGDLDVEGQMLFIRAGKFRKERLLPLRRSTVAALVNYLQRPERVASHESRAPLFVSRHGCPIIYNWARRAFRRAIDTAGIRDRDGRPPRLHDLRFTFAAHRLQAWYQEGRDVNELVPALTTYLGHADVEFTLLYLRPAAPMLRDAVDRFEAYCVPSGVRGKQ